MDTWIFWIVVIGCIMAPLIISAKTIRNLLISLRFPTSQISTLPEKGWVQVKGRIRGEAIKSPIDQVNCSFYQVEVKEYRSYGKGGNWHTLLKETSGPFELDDMTGRVKVLKSNPQVVVKNDGAMKVDDEIRSALKNLGITTTGMLGFNKRLRVYQRLVTPGEEVLVVGKIRQSEQGISISGRRLSPIIISSMDRAGMYRVFVWGMAKLAIIFYLVAAIFIVVYFLSISS